MIPCKTGVDTLLIKQNKKKTLLFTVKFAKPCLRPGVSSDGLSEAAAPP